MSIKPQPKRRTTQPGMGKVTGDSPTTTGERERFSIDEVPPTSAPPSSATPSAGPGRRQTRSIESHPPSTRSPIEPEPLESSPPRRRSRTIAPGANDTPLDTKPPRSIPLDRTEPADADGAPARSTSGTTRRPRMASGGPDKVASHRPTQRMSMQPPMGESGSATRSGRPAIRQDDVGSAVRRAPLAHLASARAVPRVLRSKAEIAAAPIDHRAGFLLAHIDGVTSVQGLVDIAGMAEGEVHEILERLCRLGIVALR